MPVYLHFSNAIRLKPEGVFVKASIDPVEWFLADRSDIRSSDYLEDIATEFDVQGLELDWVCVCIDANLRITDGKTIEPATFRGTRWQAVNDLDRRKYILNAHRVLLTRARQGVVISFPMAISATLPAGRAGMTISTITLLAVESDACK